MIWISIYSFSENSQSTHDWMKICVMGKKIKNTRLKITRDNQKMAKLLD